MNRYDFKRRGQRFVLTLIGFLLGSVAVYGTLKVIFPPSEHVPEVEDYAQFGAWGRLTITDPMTMNWVVAGEHGELLVARMKARTNDIEEIVQRLGDAVRQLDATRIVATDGDAPSVSGGPVRTVAGHLGDRRGTLIEALADGEFVAARTAWDAFASRPSPDGRVVVDVLSDSAVGITRDFGRLTALMREQREDYAALGPPSSTTSTFWSSSRLSLLEVLFFSLFGVLANLLVNSAHFLSTGEFKPSERWIAYTKLCYGPLLSLVLVLAVMFGWLDFGSYQVRAFTLPLLAFVLGYFSRRVVRLVDRLGKRLLGEAEKSIDAGPQQIADRRLQLAKEQLRYEHPRSLADLERAARRAADELTHATVVAKESKS